MFLPEYRRISFQLVTLYSPASLVARNALYGIIKPVVDSPNNTGVLTLRFLVHRLVPRARWEGGQITKSLCTASSPYLIRTDAAISIWQLYIYTVEPLLTHPLNGAMGYKTL